MHSIALATLFTALVVCNPLPQALDWDAIAQLDPIPTPSIPVVNAKAAQTVIEYKPSAAAASVAEAVAANPSGTALKIRRDDAVDNSQCATQPSPDDTVDAFFNAGYDQTASNASTPAGYSNAFTAKHGSSEGVYGYMGYAVLDSYSTATCASKCDAVVGCISFNIYYERDPVVVPGDGCTDPASTPVIKCVFWGGAVTSDSATNVGQFQRDFHVVIAGSNGYVSTSIDTPDGYTKATPLGNSGINAPLDCNGADTYMGVRTFTEGAFDAGRCAAACTATSQYNIDHPPSDGSAPQTCQFINTYILYNNTIAVGQLCRMYSDTWPASFARETGQWRGDDYFHLSYSFSFSNATNPGTPSGCNNPTSP